MKMEKSEKKKIDVSPKKTKEQIIRERKEIEFGIQRRLATDRNAYMVSLVNGRFFLARCNMIAQQLKDKKIEENVDGFLKTEEYMISEYAKTKLQAINCMRNAHFLKKDLMRDFKLTEEDIKEFEKDLYNGKIIREEYDTSLKKKSKAEFVNED